MNVSSSLELWYFFKGILRKRSVFSVFENFQVFFRKKTYLFPKNPEFWTSSEYMSNSDFRDAFEKKLAKIIVLESFQNVFFQAIYLFFQKRPISESFENFWAKKILVQILDEIRNDFCFWKLASIFFWTYYRFSQIKNQFRKFWEVLSNSTIQDAFCKKVAKVSNFSKKSSFFSKKTSFFPKNATFERFENS